MNDSAPAAVQFFGVACNLNDQAASYWTCRIETTELRPHGREAWSIAFLRTLGIERLYSSGVTSSKPCAAAISPFIARDKFKCAECEAPVRERDADVGRQILLDLQQTFAAETFVCHLRFRDGSSEPRILAHGNIP